MRSSTATIAKLFHYHRSARNSALRASLLTPLTPRPSKHNPTPFTSHLIASCPELWDEYVRHPFVVQLGQGTLPREAFKHYIAQDYHYLRHYARAHAVGAWKASDFATIQAFAEITLHIARESEMHVAVSPELARELAQPARPGETRRGEARRGEAAS